MKNFLGVLFISFCLSHLSAQEKHFVFIQSDTKQPFYVSLNSKLYSSTASGYVIIPKLVDGNYNFTIGFAQNAFPEQTFNCLIQNRDLGFELKNFNEKGWGLFNLQSLEVTMASTANSNVVSKALNESSTAKEPSAVISFDKKKEVAKPETTAVDTSTHLANNEGAKASGATTDNNGTAKVDAASVAATKTTAEVPKATSPPPTSDPSPIPEKSGDVKKVSEITSSEGVHLSYVEGKTKDTVNVIIPVSPATTTSPTNLSDTATSNVVKKDANTSQSPSSSSATSSNNVKFLDINMSAKKDTAQAVQGKTENSRVLENSNCKNIATDEDYAKLRRRMAMETSDEKMISEAKKFYRNKCFTTRQIKGLSTLFASDEGRFNFFDASFVSVVDAGQYYTLQSELIDPTFITRFKGLLQ